MVSPDLLANWERKRDKREKAAIAANSSNPSGTRSRTSFTTGIKYAKTTSSKEMMMAYHT